MCHCGTQYSLNFFSALVCQVYSVLLNDPVSYRCHWPAYADLRINGMPVRVTGRQGQQKLGVGGRDETPSVSQDTNRPLVQQYRLLCSAKAGGLEKGPDAGVFPKHEPCFRSAAGSSGWHFLLGDCALVCGNPLGACSILGFSSASCRRCNMEEGSCKVP
jgi:hypothetical protein